MNLYRTLILLCLLCLQPVQALTLHSRYDPAPLPPRWSEAELGWLRQQSQLRVGILQEDYRPFTMIARQRVEGLSADYIDLLARMLDKPVALSAFPDKAHLLRALARGEIHLASLGNLTLADSDIRAIRLSNPYFSSPLVFSVPRRYRGALLTPGQRVAAVRDQIDRARFGRYYPTLTLVTYPSNMEAFDADNIYVILTRQEEQGIDTLRSLAGKTVAMTHHVPLAQTLEGSRITQVESAAEAMEVLAQGPPSCPSILPAMRWTMIPRARCASPAPPMTSRSGWGLPACPDRGC
ncbi:transporter substrate-binding domain-containing protein [Aeromonas caviae]|nr:transporter substrate-binding domain-containing protein [Aeromonas caviae]MEB5773347.1 transporter substrate-binding domain-containing protein [Aeromonas caviae]MEB6648639.1 transporter substrate-binding domain-containing protein [Aeromonas caviae]